MITIEYHRHVPLEQDDLVGLLLTMNIGNDIPEVSRDGGLKWCPLRNETSYTAYTVTKVTTRSTTRGYYRQDIPLDEYDRKHRRWTLQGKHKEVEYLVNLVKKGDDVSLVILDKLRSTPWKNRSPNIKQDIIKCR